MRRSRAAAAFFWVALSACAGPRPEEALRAYRAALARKDVATLRELSDAGFRATWSEARLARWMKKNPRLIEAALDRTEGLRLREEAVVEDEQGRVRLVREPDGWKVAEGGLLVARFDTPEAALQTFFFAATGHQDLLRELIPEADADRFASDFALAKHLYANRERIFRARDAIGPIDEGMAVIDGDRARIPYGDGKAVELRLEGERWRVLDLE
jgi:hypothetical protein